MCSLWETFTSSQCVVRASSCSVSLITCFVIVLLLVLHRAWDPRPIFKEYFTHWYYKWITDPNRPFLCIAKLMNSPLLLHTEANLISLPGSFINIFNAHSSGAYFSVVLLWSVFLFLSFQPVLISSHLERRSPPCAVNGGAAETRYGDRRFSAEHVQHYRWAFTVVQYRAPTIHRLLSLFNLEDWR